MAPMPELASVLARDRWLVMKAAVSERCRILVAVRWSARWNGSAPPSPTCKRACLSGTPKFASGSEMHKMTTWTPGE